MSLKQWALCLMSVLCFGIVAAEQKDEKKHEEKKEVKKEEKKKEEKKEVKKEEKEHKSVALAEPIFKAFNARFKTANILEVKNETEGVEVIAKDQWNDKIKAVYAADGKLISESSHKLPLANVPAAVVETAKKWAPEAKWNDVAEVETKKGGPSVYEVSGDLNGKSIKAEIAEDGKVVKADKLPGAKKEEKKEEKKEKKEEKHDHKDHKHEEKKEVKKEEKK